MDWKDINYNSKMFVFIIIVFIWNILFPLNNLISTFNPIVHGVSMVAFVHGGGGGKFTPIFVVAFEKIFEKYVFHLKSHNYFLE